MSPPLHAGSAEEAGDGRLSELTLLRVLGKDERRTYSVLREHGRAMIPKDLVWHLLEGKG